MLHFIWKKWRKEKLPIRFILVMAAVYTASKLGKAAMITQETEEVLGRAPITFSQFARDYRSVWLP
jgi:hypothetical protein